MRGDLGGVRGEKPHTEQPKCNIAKPVCRPDRSRARVGALLGACWARASRSSFAAWQAWLVDKGYCIHSIRMSVQAWRRGRERPLLSVCRKQKAKSSAGAEYVRCSRGGLDQKRSLWQDASHHTFVAAPRPASVSSWAYATKSSMTEGQAPISSWLLKVELMSAVKSRKRFHVSFEIARPFVLVRRNSAHIVN